jgi:amidase
MYSFMHSTVPSFEFDETTIDRLHEEISSGSYTARFIAERFLARIQAMDKTGPCVNSVIELNPDALSIASNLDNRTSDNDLLRGMPVLVKDNLDTDDRMSTTAGSLALEGAVAGTDAFVVKRLREAGAIILGKANLSEWANFRSTHSVSGWSGRGGQTRNPYVLDRNPCGSSSGSAVAVSANLCVGSIGTETDGSITCPSSVNGVVGVKPTLGLVSRAGVVPIAHSQDTVGPMARTVRDAAILLSAIAGPDPADPATKDSAGKVHRDYTKFLDADGLRGARLGIPRKFFGFNAAVDVLINHSISAMKGLGAEIIDPADLPSHGQFTESEFEVLLYEFKADLYAYLAAHADSVPVRSLADIIEFNDRRRGEEMPYFDQEILVMAEKKGPLSDKTYTEALEKNHRLSRVEGIDAVVEKYKLDALVAATTGPAWLIDWVTGDHESGSCTSPAAVAGYPHVTVPAGFVHGLPVGLSFFGPAWSEPTLLRLAYAFEQATKVRKAPKFLATIDFSV